MGSDRFGMIWCGSEVEDAEEEVLEVVVAGDHGGQVFEVGSKLLQLDVVVGLDVIPAPHELIERLLLPLSSCQYLWVPPCIVRLSQLLQRHLLSRDLFNPPISLQNGLVAVLVEFSSEFAEEEAVVDLPLGPVGLDQEGNFLLIEEDLAALQSPSEISLIETAGALSIEASEDFVEESHAVDAAFSEEMSDLLVEGETVDDLVLNLGLVELLVLRGGTEQQPQVFVGLCAGGGVYGDDALLLLDEVLRLVVDEEVVSHHFVLLPERILVELVVGSEPLVGHFVLDQHCIVHPDGFACGLEALRGVGMLEHPDGVEVVLEHEGDFLQPGDLGVAGD